MYLRLHPSQMLVIEVAVLSLASLSADHPVHAPASKGNPWECEFVPDKGYLMRPVNGVFNVYKDQTAMDNNEPCSFPYPNLDTFVGDMIRLCAMIADGPL